MACRTAIVALLLAWLPGRADATIVGSVFSSPTSDDPMVVYWAPASMTLLSGTNLMLYGGVSPIVLGYQRTTPSGYDDSTFHKATMERIKPEGALGFVTDLTTERFRLGFSFSAPIVDGASWAAEYDGQPSSTRYYAVDAYQAHLVFRTAVAMRINRYLSLGFGVDVIGILFSNELYTDLGAKVNQATCQISPDACMADAPLRREDPTYQALTTVDGVGWGVGLSASLLLEPTPWLRIAASIASGAGDVTIPATVDLFIPEQLRARLDTNFPNVKFQDPIGAGEFVQRSPMVVTAGFSIHPLQRLELGADLHWVQKSTMSMMLGQLRFENYEWIKDLTMVKAGRDDYYVGARGAYRLGAALAAALRVEFNPSMRPEAYVTPTSIDYDKLHIQLGLAWQATRWLRLVGEYGHYFLFSHTVNQSRFAPNANPTTALEDAFDAPHPLGRYDGHANRFTAALQLSFF